MVRERWHRPVHAGALQSLQAFQLQLPASHFFSQGFVGQDLVSKIVPVQTSGALPLKRKSQGRAT